MIQFQRNSSEIALYRSPPNTTDINGDSLNDSVERNWTRKHPRQAVTYNVTREHQQAIVQE